ncbi:hypothetical protein BBR47_17590 [Brevibacillus brevis NBRC 100599]|uniref:Uncharacterized protein n=1 Tax=Brevibacillus brevis (strain 47 / JCM 6285 / NBRC 100599) TaxID=358681 RepID=C0ZAC7_BREBN|nr:hypothetical protein BBR47_17590 [Brevibacillus brevis NBRC 100599]
MPNNKRKAIQDTLFPIPGEKGVFFFYLIMKVA